MSEQQRRGVMYAVGCYVIWGLVPLFWKTMQDVPAIDILANRMVWSLGVVLLLLATRREWRWIGPALRSRHVVFTYLGAAVLLSFNWYIYIWSVNHGFVVESSLGYFITPLANVLLGVIFLHERLRPWQWASVGLAAAGVLYLTVGYGRPPWIALALAASFGLYGLFKKQAPLEPLRGLVLETSFMFLPALAFLFWRSATGAGSFGTMGLTTSLLLMSTGVITIFPLLWFASAARLIPLSMMGVLQYISPTMTFILGLTIYHEPFTATKLVGFMIIWAALALYWAEGAIRRNRLAAA
jgi:chloramphenicol-sensitive protein RarD